MRNWIRRWLGINDLIKTTNWIYDETIGIARNMSIMRTASDELGRRMIQQMNAEAKARKLTTDGN